MKFGNCDFQDYSTTFDSVPSSLLITSWRHCFPWAFVGMAVRLLYQFNVRDWARRDQNLSWISPESFRMAWLPSFLFPHKQLVYQLIARNIYSITFTILLSGSPTVRGKSYITFRTRCLISCSSEFRSQFMQMRWITFLSFTVCLLVWSV